MPSPKLKWRLPVRSRMTLVGILEEFGVAVGHRPRQPESLALFQHDAVDLQVLGDGAAVTRRRCEVPQELLGRRVEQCVAFAAQPLALIGVLREPLQRVRGQCRGGVEAAADQQHQHAHDLHVGRWLSVDAHSDHGVDQSGSRRLPDLRDVAHHLHCRRDAQVGDSAIVRRVGGRVHPRVGGFAVDLPVLQRYAQQTERQHRGHDVREVVDEVDPTVSIFSSRHALTISSTTGTHRCTAAGER